MVETDKRITIWLKMISEFTIWVELTCKLQYGLRCKVLQYGLN